MIHEIQAHFEMLAIIPGHRVLTDTSPSLDRQSQHSGVKHFVYQLWVRFRKLLPRIEGRYASVVVDNQINTHGLKQENKTLPKHKQSLANIYLELLLTKCISDLQDFNGNFGSLEMGSDNASARNLI